ncbi:ribosome maturation factor RimM [Ohessyouella blattaphilus]|uniref:Ribosome maturation factor RimM n=1 Tax=Ohessyouella blattaphilus TaxID=2949333 RepID=A0ABT1EF61_9FIRM|nr:ribosome maturation factor RimM [Ohessyouella blattaphilus]MCP1109343.1 ribosome maturation factor RimM [Ohessyouella blattaphilus]MCR8562737.1 ribosome maturation factor RimM [Ohessyouella blattaphilus]
MEDLLRVGVISSTHGIRGEVKVYPTTDEKERFLELKEVILDTGKEKRVLTIAGVKFFKNMVILKFKGIDNINDIEKYRQCELFVTREDATPLEEDEYYFGDLIGLAVFDEEHKEIGRLTDILETGANDVYVVKTVEGKELLLPAIRDCIKEIDIEGQEMTVHIMEGLL